MEYLLLVWVGLLSYFFFRSQRELKKKLRFWFDRQEERVEELHAIRAAQSQQLDEMNVHFSHLNKAIIWHLHASGTVYKSRIWDTYSAELYDHYELREEEPSGKFLTPDACTPPEELNLNIDEYNFWRKQTASTHYADHPNERIDSKYIFKLKQDWA